MPRSFANVEWLFRSIVFVIRGVSLRILQPILPKINRILNILVLFAGCLKTLPFLFVFAERWWLIVTNSRTISLEFWVYCVYWFQFVFFICFSHTFYTNTLLIGYFRLYCPHFIFFHLGVCIEKPAHSLPPLQLLLSCKTLRLIELSMR